MSSPRKDMYLVIADFHHMTRYQPQYTTISPYPYTINQKHVQDPPDVVGGPEAAVVRGHGPRQALSALGLGYKDFRHQVTSTDHCPS